MSKLPSQREIQIRFLVSKELLTALQSCVGKVGQDLYVVGGTVRDYLLGKKSADLDIAVSGAAIECAKMLTRELHDGTIVDLSGPQDESFRVVFRGEQIDFSSFRMGAETIEQDLVLRDFSINALAIPLADLLEEKAFILVDPTGGRGDLDAGVVRQLPGAFVEDPVRLLRGYRLCAVLGFALDLPTIQQVHEHAALVKNVAVERVQGELEKIFQSPRTSQILREMDDAGLLAHLFPELYVAKGIDQPDFHHLDVFDHCFKTLQEMEGILRQPGLRFGRHLELVQNYLAEEGVSAALKWAALFHDLGKPETRGFGSTDKERVTFYGHDEAGKIISKQIAHRLKWSGRDCERVTDLVGMHMHPFHLCNVERQSGVSRRAVLKLCRRAEENLVGLFLLAMADSLASEGKLKPPQMEEELLELFDKVVQMYEELIKPVMTGPRLVTGADLIREFELVPGPIFSEILGELEVARVEGEVNDRKSALQWVANYLQNSEKGDWS